MNTDKQRILIGVACGEWTDCYIESGQHGDWDTPMGKCVRLEGDEEMVDRYEIDLNDMQRAFQTLGTEQKRKCTFECNRLLGKGQFLFDATAGQWAEAFLRTLGLWEMPTTNGE